MKDFVEHQLTRRARRSPWIVLSASFCVTVACRSQSNASHGGVSPADENRIMDAGGDVDMDAGPANPIGPIATRGEVASSGLGGSANAKPSAPPPYDIPGGGRGEEFGRGGKPGKVPIGLLTQRRAEEP